LKVERQLGACLWISISAHALCKESFATIASVKILLALSTSSQQEVAFRLLAAQSTLSLDQMSLCLPI
jgi:hypothetical protein